MKIISDSTLLLTGDSITDCGRNYPLGRRGGLGEGYVSMLDSELSQHDITILNTGISGNRVPDLESRWEKDVMRHEPDWLSILIGINDVWRQFDSPLAMVQVSIEEYEGTYRRLLDRTVPSLEGLILMTPYIIEPDRSDSMRAVMDRYGAVVKNIADDYAAVLVDTQSAFDDYLQNADASLLAGDRIHPNAAGHRIIADAFLESVS